MKSSVHLSRALPKPQKREKGLYIPQQRNCLEEAGLCKALHRY